MSRPKATARQKIDCFLHNFWSRVNISDPNDCWEWQGGKQRGGYGETFYNGRNLSAHRVSWFLSFGAIKKGYHICHKCDNPPCCNPEHLFQGTRKDNMNDAKTKKRNWHPIGSLCGNSKLTEANIHVIRGLLKQGMSAPKIAKIYNVGSTTIYNIHSGRCWRHI